MQIQRRAAFCAGNAFLVARCLGPQRTGKKVEIDFGKGIGPHALTNAPEDFSEQKQRILCFVTMRKETRPMQC